MNNLYNEIITAKSNEKIPLFNSGKSMHSKYSPVREAESFGSEIQPGANYTIILGLGGAYHVDSFYRHHPDHKIMVIEESQNDINLLSQIECVKKLNENSNILITSKENFQQFLIDSYIPAFHGGINILCHRAWYDNNKNSADEILKKLDQTIKYISKDFSVQSHFGFIWQKNILSNLKILGTNKIKTIKFDINKTAAIIAAGPSLDFTVSNILKERNKYCIFATDTSLNVLASHNIKPDAVISIDGQNISYQHFIGYTNPDTTFIFDLQANFNAVNYVSKYTSNIIFIKSGHPFCNYAEPFSDSEITKIDCGAGTVTIAAIDFAKKAGFTDFEVFGADFSYRNNKPYTKGTYLDTLYRLNENKLLASENLYTNLLYRTEITRNENIIETEILNSYKKTFIEWINSYNLKYTYENSIYKISANNQKTNIIELKTLRFDYEKFIKILCADAKKINESDLKTIDHPLIISSLPLISYLRTKTPNLTFSEAVKLALSKILEYT
ncbi:MAG: DUF115 domain-containing protein [Treponema sp.]|uniref:6-hydroxymethylpterin diphosphokinase MptE-like protein n=1 Tax=Treponema sp. TaxID=166 RepID=UPI00298E48B0|nr:6-hydroxymethylpterin diphosphokinase MptE-like protein [Treponema sp.]MCQ2600023.1 DUF115 domain-containing protein [Treponema sp.]